MTMKPNTVDDYLAQGCGRCALGGTPECKVHLWPAALKDLRAILRASGLQEEIKWSAPCYTYQSPRGCRRQSLFRELADDQTTARLFT